MELCATAEAQSLADIEAQNRANQETQNLASLQMYHGGGLICGVMDFFNIGDALVFDVWECGGFCPLCPLYRVCFCAVSFIFMETIILFQAVFFL